MQNRCSSEKYFSRLVGRELLSVLLMLLASALVPIALAQQDRSSIVVQKAESPCNRSTQQRLALVIGNGSYPTRPLRNPPNDAVAVAKALRELGFLVTTGIDKSQAEMEQMIRDFGQHLRSSCGVGLFYYAGHGGADCGPQLFDSG